MKKFRQTTSLLLVAVMLAGMVPAAWAEEPAGISEPEAEVTGSPEEQIIEAESVTEPEPDAEQEPDTVPGPDEEPGSGTEPEPDAEPEGEAEPEPYTEPESALYELSAEERSAILGRDDGVWLFPVDKEYYGDIADFCGCRGEEPCLFCGEVHYNCADAEHGNTDYGHFGLDIDVPEGTEVMAPAGGILYWTDYEFDGIGYTAIIEHTYENGWAYYTVFKHLQSISLPSGSEVKAGDVFAYSGKSGSIDEWPHLHFAMFMAAEACGEDFASDPVKELAFIEAQGWLSEYQGCGMIVNNPSPWSEASPLPGDEAIQAELDKHPGTVKYTFDRTKTTLAPYTGEDPESPGPVIVDSGNCGSSISWTLDNSGNLIISGSGSMSFPGTGSPWKDNSAVKNLIIEKGITDIGTAAFSGCVNLVSAAIADTVTQIGTDAFYLCSSLEEAVIPDSVTYIGSNAFQNCTALKSVSVPASLRTVESDAFFSCTGLCAVNISDLGAWMEIDFQGGSDSNPLNSAHVLCLNGSPVRALTIPQGTVQIKPFTFAGASCIESVQIPDSVTVISQDAFCSCTELAEVSIPDSVRDIESGAFAYCSSLKRVKLCSSLTSAGTGIFEGCTQLEDINLPDSIEKIPEDTFSGCTGLREITIPDSVLKIGLRAFRNCSSICELKIPGSVYEIGAQAFEGCTAFADLTIGNFKSSKDSSSDSGDDSVPETEGPSLGIIITAPDLCIRNDAFRNCSSLKRILLRKGVSEINKYAFSGCTSLKDVYYAGSKSDWAEIDKHSSNTELLSATIHYNFRGGSLAEIGLKNFSLIVKGNKKDAEKEKESFRLLPEVKITDSDSDISAETDARGGAVIKTGSGSLTFSKAGYVSRTISMARLEKDSSVYMQKESEHPVINALWVDDEDILHNEVYTDPLKQNSFVLQPEVNWGKCGKGTLKLVQEGQEMTLQEGESTVSLAEHFDVVKDIYLIAESSNGLGTKKKFSFLDENVKALQGFTFDLGDSLSFTLQDDCSIMSGVKMDIGLKSFVPVEFVLEDGKFYASFGLQLGGEYDRDKKAAEIKSFSDSVKDMKKAWEKADTSAAQYQKVQSCMKAFTDDKGRPGKIAVCKASFGVEGDASLMGFAEGYINDKKELILTCSGGIIAFGTDLKYSQPFMAGAMPMFLEFKFSADLAAQFNNCINQKIKKFTPQINIELDLGLSGGVGVGLKDVVSVSGGLKGNLKNTLNLDQGTIDYYRLQATLNWYIRLRALFFKFEKEDKIAEATWIEYRPPARAANLALSDGAPEPHRLREDMCDMSQYVKDDLSYLEAGSEFMGRSTDGPVTFAEPGTETGKPFVSNAYEGAAPQIVLFPDGTALAVWIGYNREYSDADALNLCYSYFDTAWSSPRTVEDDGTSDNTPCLRLIGDTAYLVWQDADSSLAGLDLAGTAPHMGISAAVFDRASGTFGEAVSVTGGGVLNTAPALCGGEDSVYAVWTRNGANDWFGQNSENSIMYSSFDGSAWSAPSALYSGLNPVINFAADGSSGLSVAYTLDTDGDLGTIEDMEIYRDGTAVTANDYPDCGVCFDSGNLYWYSGGKLVCNGEPCMAEDAYISSDRFQIVNGAILYTEEDGLSSVLKIAYANSSGWGSPIVLCHDASASVPFFSAASTPDGQLRILMEKQAVVGDYDSENPYGEADLWWYNAPQASCNLRLDDVYADNSNYVQGRDMTFYLTVSNTAELEVPEFRAEVTDTSGNTVLSRVISSPLLSGQTREFRLNYTVSETVPGTKLSVRISAEGMNENDLSDNSREIILGWNDIAVENARWGISEDDKTVICADIVNRGCEDQSSITVNLRGDRADGEILQTQTVGSVPSMSLHNISFIVDSEPDRIYYVCAEHKETDDFYGNDRAFVRTRFTPDNEYYITYNANGGINAPEPQMKLSGETLIITAEVPEREGFSFLGWAENSVDTAAKYKPGDEYIADEDATLYAVWEKSAFTVSYDANGGMNAPGPQVKKSGEALEITSEVPEREGFSFLGWAENSVDTAVKYRPGDEYAADEDVTLYAVWKEYIPEADLNSDGVSDVMDAVVLMKGLVEETPGSDTDLNDDGITDILDLIALMKKISQ